MPSQAQGRTSVSGVPGSRQMRHSERGRGGGCWLRSEVEVVVVAEVSAAALGASSAIAVAVAAKGFWLVFDGVFGEGLAVAVAEDDDDDAKGGASTGSSLHEVVALPDSALGRWRGGIEEHRGFAFFAALLFSMLVPTICWRSSDSSRYQR